MVGVIQEQHPDRCRLFMQWKQMGWPILVDTLNLLEVPYVPITLYIDEQGIIRQIHGPLSDAARIEEEFLKQFFGPVETPALLSAPSAPENPPEGEDPAGLRDFANQVVLWGGPERLGEAIEAYTRALALEPADGHTLFRLGAAYRLRHDSDHRETRDFQNAVTSWDMALHRDPNNYIWRRRIQQYGPRLEKPYPFYDWVTQARSEIEARGESPVPLATEPKGAELAEKAGFEPAERGGAEPDPDGRLLRDRENFVRIETAVVPPTISPGQTARVHLRLEPIVEKKAHWNNEVEELKLWLNPPENWEVSERELSFPNPASGMSTEPRELEFELRAPAHTEASAIAIPAYALYYVCEDEDGVCLYRRQDVDIRVQVNT
jgi:tetratricopeptide (TPR) repeat protein